MALNNTFKTNAIDYFISNYMQLRVTVAALTLWNSLPEELRNVHELGSFKRQLN